MNTSSISSNLKNGINQGIATATTLSRASVQQLSGTYHQVSESRATLIASMIFKNVMAGALVGACAAALLGASIYGISGFVGSISNGLTFFQALGGAITGIIKGIFDGAVKGLVLGMIAGGVSSSIEIASNNSRSTWY